MNIYKLKKWYPSLPLDYSEGDLIAFPKGIHECHNGHRIHEEETGASEFWEPVVEKDCEIISVKGNNSGRIESYNTYHQISNQKYDWSIHSIRRLSDGEVFIVGDRVELKRENPYCGYGVKYEIEGFKVCKNECCDYVDVKLKDKGTMPLIGAELVKQPLFQTEDAVDIFEGDTYYELIHTYDNGGISYMEATAQKDCIPERITFSTKEKMSEYIENNKPLYSRKDIEEAMDKIGFYDMSKQTYNKSLWFHLDK